MGGQVEGEDVPRDDLRAVRGTATHHVILSPPSQENSVETCTARDPQLWSEKGNSQHPPISGPTMNAPSVSSSLSDSVPADGSMSVRLTVTAGPHSGRTFAFTGHDTFVVGRSKKAHFRLPEKDEYFSRIHFLVEVNPPRCRLLDLGSTNGTAVNGRKVSVADLAHGDLIQGGQTAIRVDVIDAEEE